MRIVTVLQLMMKRIRVHCVKSKRAFGLVEAVEGDTKTHVNEGKTRAEPGHGDDEIARLTLANQRETWRRLGIAHTQLEHKRTIRRRTDQQRPTNGNKAETRFQTLSENKHNTR